MDWTILIWRSMRKVLALILFFTIGTAFAALKIGDTAPDFTLPDIRTGDEVSLSDFRGQVVIMQLMKCN